MRTRSQSRNSNRQQQQVPHTFIEPFDLEEPIDNQAPPVVTMADNRTIAQLLEAPTEGYEDAIVVPKITADNFKLKHGLLTLVQNKQFFGHDKEDPHAHIRYFNKITSMMKFPNVPTLAYQALVPQTQGVSKEDFQNKIKANDAVMRNMQNQTQNMQNQMTNLTDLLTKFMNTNTASTSGLGSLPSNTIANPKSDLKAITTRSGISYNETQVPPPPSSLPKVVERKTEVTKDMVPPTNNESTKDIQPLVVQVETHVPISVPVVAPISAPKPNPKPSIQYPSRLNDQKIRKKANNQIEKFYQIFQDLHFDISFADALILMPKFASTLKSLISNKEKLFELARTPLNEHCSAVLLKKLPKKLGDPGKFLIPCDFPGMDECLALADLGASINLMPLSVWKKLSLPELTPTCMTLELADRSISQPIGITEDVYVKVRKFQFPADFVVVDFDADPRVPLILGRCFLKTGRALIDVYEGELTLRVGNKAITFNLDQTLRYSANYNDMTANRIDVIDMTCEEYSQEVLGFFDVIASGNTTPYYDPIVFTFSPTLTPFRDNDFLLDEVDAFLAIEDDPTSPEGDDKLPIIIAKDLSVEEKAAVIKILMEEDYKPAVQHQRRVNLKIYDVIKKEVEKLLDAGLIYPISDSPWFGTPRAIISDRGTHFCNDQFSKVLLKYGVTHRLATAYHPQTSGQVEVSNRGLKRILERTIGENRASWSDKLDDVLWAFRTTYKTPIGCTPYKLVYGKVCHLPIKLEHKAYWALKHANFDLSIAGDHRKVQLNELNELCDQAYENSLIYKEKTKRIHDSKIKNLIFNVGDQVLLFNSRLKIFSGKLKTHWSGPFTIAHVYPYGTVKLSQSQTSR
ncbi:reverse transcriptase domain-containing protein [Tanacetum coccineum]